MSHVHLIDFNEQVVGCSTATEFTDYNGLPVGMGACEHELDRQGWPWFIVDVPMPPYDPSLHKRIFMSFVGVS